VDVEMNVTLKVAKILFGNAQGWEESLKHVCGVKTYNKEEGMYLQDILMWV
jgi:hypothetical protein